jgi:hypothetical protein
MNHRKLAKIFEKKLILEAWQFHLYDAVARLRTALPIKHLRSEILVQIKNLRCLNRLIATGYIARTIAGFITSASISLRSVHTSSRGTHDDLSITKVNLKFWAVDYLFLVYREFLGTPNLQYRPHQVIHICRFQ